MAVKHNLDRDARMAAGHVLLTQFHIVQSGVRHPLRMLIDPRLAGYDLTRGLTPKEAELVEKTCRNLEEIAEVLRVLGWRCLK
jgi:hypothetical protein